MDEGKAAIRRGIRTRREARRNAGDATSRLAQRDGLLSCWGEVLAELGFDPDSTSLLPALFVPTPWEPDVTAILAAHPSSLLPVLVDDSGRPLGGAAWGHHESTATLVSPSPRRPPQPAGPVLGPEGLAEADVVLVAALAVDEGGSRLGQGGGWYDRALLAARPGVPVVAAVFEDEVFPAGVLPREDHDRVVDAVITPTGARLLG